MLHIGEARMENQAVVLFKVTWRITSVFCTQLCATMQSMREGTFGTKVPNKVMLTAQKQAKG